MIIIGGTYDEYCLEPRWEEKFGSGLRACWVVSMLNPKRAIEFHTFGDENVFIYLDQLRNLFPKIDSHITRRKGPISFYYDHPLINPRIFPRPDTLFPSKLEIRVKGQNILYYGFMEGRAIIEGETVVYDPQSPSNPVPFSQTGSKAKKLCYVVNMSEAAQLAGGPGLPKIKNFMFKREKAQILILKMGPKGAMVITNNGEKSQIVPVYKTNSVWPIGTGDVYAAAFAENWFANNNPFAAAKQASLITAIYSETKQFEFSVKRKFQPLNIKRIPTGQIYLAGPFFTYAERWLVDQVRSTFLGMNLKVFSPWHDIGHGLASDVVDKDLKGLHKSKLLFAILDGLDSGTLFEIGYAVSKKIPVIAYVENESEESVKMLEGTNCILEKDLTTAIYKTLWLLSKNG